jgi:hypothetical protein
MWLDMSVGEDVSWVRKVNSSCRDSSKQMGKRAACQKDTSRTCIIDWCDAGAVAVPHMARHVLDNCCLVSQRLHDKYVLGTA